MKHTHHEGIRTNEGQAMAHLKIPAALDTITTEWLTKALHSTGMITNATVKSFDINMLGEGQGFTGQIGRFQLDYDIEEEDAPRSLVAKFPAINPKVRATLNRFRIYEREIRFYQEIAEEIELRTPHFYYSDLDIETGESILLLEDLTHARVGNNVAGCSPAEAELAIRDLAKFHATWWESPQLEEIRWMPAFDDDAESLQELYQQLWEPFTEKFKDFLSDEFLELGFRFGKNVVNIGKQLSQPPQTIVHGDYRLDNLLFSSPESGTMLTVIDWQVAQRGRGVSDVAYFLGGESALRTTERHRHESPKDIPLAPSRKRGEGVRF